MVVWANPAAKIIGEIRKDFVKDGSLE